MYTKAAKMYPHALERSSRSCTEHRLLNASMERSKEWGQCNCSVHIMEQPRHPRERVFLRRHKSRCYRCFAHVFEACTLNGSSETGVRVFGTSTLRVGLFLSIGKKNAEFEMCFAVCATEGVNNVDVGHFCEFNLTTNDHSTAAW